MDHEVKKSRPSWPARWNTVSTKNTKISWAWWCTPVVPATWEAEAGELLEPRRWRLWWAEIAPLHSSLGNKSETPSQKKKEKEMFPTQKVSSATRLGCFWCTSTNQNWKTHWVCSFIELLFMQQEQWRVWLTVYNLEPHTGTCTVVLATQWLILGKSCTLSTLQHAFL